MVPGGKRTSRARSVSDFVAVFNGFIYMVFTSMLRGHVARA